MEQELKPSTGMLFIGLGTAKIFYLLVLILGIETGSTFNDKRASIIREFWFENGWKGESRGEFEKHFATWDSEHYLYLSEFGYSKGLRSCAFYPLWPLTVRLGSWLTASSHLVVGMVLANLFSAIGWCFFFRIVERRFGREIGILSLFFLIAFPGALFFQFVYSESLFFLLMMTLWWGLENRQNGIAIIAAFLLPLVRGVGAFAVIPLAWYWIALLPDSVAPSWSWLTRERRANGVRLGSRLTQDLVWRTFLLMAPAVGWGCYLLLMWGWTGSLFEGVDAQKHWQHTHSVKNLVDLPKFVIGFFDVASLHSLRGSMLDRVGFVGLLMCVPVIWRHGKDLFAWTLMLGLVPAISGTFASFIRFEALVFPIFIALGIVATGEKGSKLRLVCFLGFGLVHAYLVWRFVNYYWAG